MNKLFFVLLAICLVSAHAFVKRDAPATASPTEQDYLAKMQKQLGDISKDIQNQIAQALDPEVIKQNIATFSEKVNDVISKIKPAQPASPQ